MTQPANDVLFGEFDDGLEDLDDDAAGLRFGPKQRQLFDALRGAGVRPPYAVKGCLGFRFDGFYWTSQPQRRFKPRGLMIWGAPDGALLEQATIGNCMEVLQSCDGVPAKFFGFGKSYADVATLVDEGVEPPAWCSWNSVELGCLVRISVRDRNGKSLGPDDGLELCMWGTALRLKGKP